MTLNRSSQLLQHSLFNVQAIILIMSLLGSTGLKAGKRTRPGRVHPPCDQDRHEGGREGGRGKMEEIEGERTEDGDGRGGGGGGGRETMGRDAMGYSPLHVTASVSTK